MAIFHFHTSIVKRSAGRSVVAAAAWQRGIDLDDGLLGRTHAYAMRGPGAWSAILLPAAAARAWSDPGRLWNAVEAREVRKDAQLARLFKLSLPYELSPEQNIDLVRRFAQHTFVETGMVVDVTVRLLNAKSEPNPFASLLATTRTLVVSDGQCSFGNKVTTWNTRASLFAWRATWASEVNASLEAAGSPERVDHRSMAERGLEVEPQIGVGVIARRRYERGLPSDRVAENEAILRRREVVKANAEGAGEAPGSDDLSRVQVRL